MQTVETTPTHRRLETTNRAKRERARYRRRLNRAKGNGLGLECLIATVFVLWWLNEAVKWAGGAP